MATRGQFSTKSPTIKRILREANELSTAPSPDYTATPLDEDLFEWHFTLRGPPGSSSSTPTITGVYEEGIYHGRIILPPTYPLRPPSFRFLTPSGRFETNREICLSISGHHEETWQPAWGLRTALVALRSFMETDAKGQLGGLECSDAVRRRMAKESRAWKCSGCGKSNEDILKECAATAKETDSVAKDERVPKELKMGWKDEMGQDKKDDAETAELAEGFVQTAPVTLPILDAQSAPYPPARPAQTVPQPTGTASSSTTTTRRPAAVAYRARAQPEGVPAWVDKAIAAVVACLSLMVLKVILGY